jgi:hypothetical protein
MNAPMASMFLMTTPAPRPFCKRFHWINDFRSEARAPFLSQGSRSAHVSRAGGDANSGTTCSRAAAKPCRSPANRKSSLRSLQTEVVVRRGVGETGDQAEARFSDARASAVDEGELPDRA